MLNLVLIDDHAVVRKGLRSILEEEFDDVEVREADCARDGLRLLRGRLPDAVVLDISLPDMNGLEVLTRIRSAWPHLPVLILSIYGEDQYGVRMIRSGASGYLAKSSAPEYLVTALRRVTGGQRYISPELADQLAASLEEPAGGADVTALSNREYQVFCLLAEGKTVTEVATELHLSVKTISTHRHHILHKMNMRNNADIVSYARNKVLIDQI